MQEQRLTAAAARPKILVVEDDPGVRRSLQLLLQGRGFDVRSYASGAALLADRTTRDAACFVADYAMPDIDGMALLRELRADGWNGPAVLITAYHSPTLEERATIEGFARVFQKPLMDHVLTDAVAKLAGGLDA
ncbi:response regulator [Sphingomonas sp. MMS24-J13]|uniref:response regulator n=1 Tax=Sphingomonas sp. MMS24-J13 TaxID=3238686 RepID=UPI0038514938